MTAAATAGGIGADVERVDAMAKACGSATYAAEYRLPGMVYGFLVQATIPKGRVTAIDGSAALTLPRVVGVLWHGNAPRLQPSDDPSLAVLQSDRIAYHGQIVAVALAETLEAAREAAAAIDVRYQTDPHDSLLRDEGLRFERPEKVNGQYAGQTETGDVEVALAAAPVRLALRYTTPPEVNNPLEPHATIAQWGDGSLRLYDCDQGPYNILTDVAAVFGLEPERVRVTSPFVGGAFGSKAFTHPHVIATALAAKLVGRPVCISLTRQQMFSLVGYRTPTIQHVRVGAERDGRLLALDHLSREQTSTVELFAEQTTVLSRIMYATPALRTAHEVAALDVPTPSIFRAPGETPGSFGLECAIDELAAAVDVDPVELRIRNEPDRGPESGLPYSSRHLPECLREGARRFGWTPHPRPRRRGLDHVAIGHGVAASTYPSRLRPSKAQIVASPPGEYVVRIAASDLGTGAWTALRQIAADALGVGLSEVRLEIGDSVYPRAPGAGGSMGTASWGTAIYEAAQELRRRLRDEHGGDIPADWLTVEVETERNPNAGRYEMHAFGAQFVEVRVDRETGEVRVPRMVGVFAAGRIVNPRTARSQLIGGMTMGLSMALEEGARIDGRFGHFANHDLAEYHVAVNADVPAIEIATIDEDDPYVNPLGIKGIGEIGMVGTAAAIANAVFDATGIRIRDLPITPAALLTALEAR